jgi:hypothetical protein
MTTDYEGLPLGAEWRRDDWVVVQIRLPSGRKRNVAHFRNEDGARAGAYFRQLCEADYSHTAFCIQRADGAPYSEPADGGRTKSD